MKNENDAKVVKIHNEALELFCLKKAEKYIIYLKKTLATEDLKMIRNISEELAGYLYAAGAMQLNYLVLKLCKRVDSPGANKLKIFRKVLMIIKLIENLKNEYKDYVNTECVYKRINLLSTRSNFCCIEQQEIEDFYIEEDFCYEWRCLVQ